jgi:hypothetical protein
MVSKPNPGFWTAGSPVKKLRSAILGAFGLLSQGASGRMIDNFGWIQGG